MKHSVVKDTYNLNLGTLIEKSHKVHLKHHPLNKVQASRLLSIKTGGCPENCKYCPQSAHYNTGVKSHGLMEVEEVVKHAKEAKKDGASRFCMGAAWRQVKKGNDFNKILKIIKAVSDLGMESCCTLGMLNYSQAVELKKAGLYAYNHNIDCSKNFYKKIISTRNYEDRLDTINNVRKAGITVCTGGIIGMGEEDTDRVDFIFELSKIKPHPESITINALVPIKGTPLGEKKIVSPLIIARVIGCVRMVIPKSMIRLSAGRINMDAGSQFLMFYSGANSIFLGDKLLTSDNPPLAQDKQMLKEAGISLV